MTHGAERGVNMVYICYDKRSVHEYRYTAIFGHAAGLLDYHHAICRPEESPPQKT